MEGFMSESDAAVLLAARDTLRKLRDAAVRESWGDGKDEALQLGMFSEACDAASDSLFNAMNVAQAHLEDQVALRAIRS